MKNSKRIQSIKVIREMDTDPDTSYLGKYSQTAKSGYAIDRAHWEDCASITPLTADGERILKHARAYIFDLQSKVDADSAEWTQLDEAYFLLDDLTEESECDCGGHHVGRNEYQYFNPNWQNYQGDTEENIRKYCRQDYARMENYNNQQWYYLGIHAKANIQLTNNAPIQTIYSGGIWGIESDSDESFLKKTEQEELSALRDELKSVGFSARAISTAFKNIEEVSL